MRILLILVLIIFTTSSYAQGWIPVGSRSSSLANTSVCISDVWAYHHNPGATASIKSISIGTYYDARFLMKELQNQAVAVAIPLRVGVISTGAQFMGYEQYRNIRAGVGYSMKFFEYLQVGVQGNVQTLRFGNNYGKTVSGTVEAGILSNITEKWSIGVSVLNIGRQRIGILKDRFSTVMRLGCKFSPSKKVSVMAEVEKQVITKISFRGAVEYQPIESLYIRAGVQSAPVEFAFGIGYTIKGFAIDLGSKYHQTLGWSPNAGLSYQFKERQHAK